MIVFINGVLVAYFQNNSKYGILTIFIQGFTDAK
jgi:hypothetical protein